MTAPLVLWVLAGLLLWAPAASGAGELAVPEPVLGAVPATPSARFAPGHLIVQWAPGADRADRASARAEAEVILRRTLGDAAFQLLEVDSGQTVGDPIHEPHDEPPVV